MVAAAHLFDIQRLLVHLFNFVICDADMVDISDVVSEKAPLNLILISSTDLDRLRKQNEMHREMTVLWSVTPMSFAMCSVQDKAS